MIVFDRLEKLTRDFNTTFCTYQMCATETTLAHLEFSYKRLYDYMDKEGPSYSYSLEDR